jgi:hypothetical protein
MEIKILSTLSLVEFFIFYFRILIFPAYLWFISSQFVLNFPLEYIPSYLLQRFERLKLF